MNIFEHSLIYGAAAYPILLQNIQISLLCLDFVKCTLLIFSDPSDFY